MAALACSKSLLPAPSSDAATGSQCAGYGIARLALEAYLWLSARQDFAAGFLSGDLSEEDVRRRFMPRLATLI
jgi:hypothetical protein